jgi:integrase
MDTNLLREDIKINRPKITDNSIKTYISILKNIFVKYHDEDDEFNIHWFENEKKLINKLKDVPPNIRKTLYSALIAINDNKHNQLYKKQMMIDAEHYKSENLKQNKSEAQKENWVTQDEIKKKFDEMFKNIKGLWTKPDLNKYEYQKLQDLILVALTSGIFIPPRRAIDWCEVVIKDIDDKNDNYISRGKFYFNKYKGSDKKGQQIVEIPKPLLLLLKKFIRVNPNKYLLVDSQNKKMNSSKINQHLERIWGKKSGVNIFRHSYLSEKYPIYNVEELKKDAENMGTSSNMILNTYIKKE